MVSMFSPGRIHCNKCFLRIEIVVIFALFDGFAFVVLALFGGFAFIGALATFGLSP